MRRSIGFFSVMAVLSTAACGADLTGVCFDIVTGCGDEDISDFGGGGFDLAPFVSKIVIEPDSARLVVGETRDFRATTFGRSGDTVVVSLQWRSRDTTVITVSPAFNRSGETVTARARGAGEVFIRVSGGCCFGDGGIAQDSVKVLVE